MMRMLVSVLLIIVLWLTISLANSNAYFNTNTYDTIYVKSGDTVWNIAAKYVTDKDDIRELIVAIRQANDLNNNAQILPGQTLKVPVKR